MALPETNSIWMPMRHAIFRNLWIASLVSNVGTWIQNVAGVWLMTSLTSSVTLVALMQTATTLPVLLIGVPAAALADIFDRRRLIIGAGIWMLVAATVLWLVTLTNLVSEWWLLALTFSLGVGSALSIPAWQAVIPEVVSHEDLHAAVTLNGITVNIARAVGPALGVPHCRSCRASDSVSAERAFLSRCNMGGIQVAAARKGGSPSC